MEILRILISRNSGDSVSSRFLKPVIPQYITRPIQKKIKETFDVWENLQSSRNYELAGCYVGFRNLWNYAFL